MRVATCGKILVFLIAPFLPAKYICAKFSLCMQIVWLIICHDSDDTSAIFWLTLSSSKRDIPVKNYRMHTLHCARNVMLCPECQEPIPRSELEEHQKEEHSLKTCDLCNAQMEPKELAEHKVSPKGISSVPCHWSYHRKLINDLPSSAIDVSETTSNLPILWDWCLCLWYGWAWRLLWQ